MSETEKKHGGKRVGAGRKKDAPVVGSKKMSIRIDIDLIDFLNNQENKARLINNLIRAKMNEELDDDSNKH